VHHSREDRHWDKNLGLFLSVWDRWYGTFVYSQPRGSFRLGLADDDEIEKYRSVLQLYTTPFVNVGRMVLRSLRSKGIAPLPQGNRVMPVLHGQILGPRDPGAVVQDGSAAAVSPSGYTLRPASDLG
jgi:hypothetical protein